jgi:hypothetical protein
LAKQALNAFARLEKSRFSGEESNQTLTIGPLVVVVGPLGFEPGIAVIPGGKFICQERSIVIGISKQHKN